MRLEIIRKIDQKETIEIELPYYYKHDLMSDYSDSVIYGKVEEKLHTAIKISYIYQGGSCFELESEKRNASYMSCYMTDEFKISEKEYLSAKEKLLAAASAA
jgi:hypothetical protein